MGSGRWSTDAYRAAESYRRRAGRGAFAFSDHQSRTSRSDWRAHPSLDPYGLTVRESRDSAEHPTATPIAVLFDVTGSMQSVPRVLQTRLPALFGLLVERRYVRDPQVLFGAVGDATCDRVPLQLGQFESDNRTDEQLGNIFLEGGGGGQLHESYELAMYAMARHTALDSHQRRGRRGYLFLIGDEMAYGAVKAREVREVFGDTLDGDIPLPVILDELRERYEVFFLIPEGAAHRGNRGVRDFWHRLLGQNVIELDDLDAVSATIALIVGLGEEAVTLDEGLDDLAAYDAKARATVARALTRGPDRR